MPNFPKGRSRASQSCCFGLLLPRLELVYLISGSLSPFCAVDLRSSLLPPVGPLCCNLWSRGGRGCSRQRRPNPRAPWSAARPADPRLRNFRRPQPGDPRPVRARLRARHLPPPAAVAAAAAWRERLTPGSGGGGGEARAALPRRWRDGGVARAWQHPCAVALGVPPCPPREGTRPESRRGRGPLVRLHGRRERHSHWHVG